MNKYSKILIINPFGIGDVLFAIPLIKNIKENFPKAKIGFLCNKRTSCILNNQPEIDYVFEYERDEFRKVEKKSKWQGIKKHIGFLNTIKRERFDVVFDLSLNSTYGFFSLYSGIKKRIGFNYKNRGRFLNCKVEFEGYKEKPVADYYLDLLKFLGIKSQKKEMSIYLPGMVKEKAQRFLKEKGVDINLPIVMITPCGGKSWGDKAALKHWDYKKFAQLANRLKKDLKCNLVLAGSFSEGDTINKISSLIESCSLSVVGWPLLEFLGLLSQIDVLITNDGGPLHMGVSVGVKTVSIFGPVDDRVYGPYTLNKDKHIVIKKDYECRPCYRSFRVPDCKNNRKCLKDISVEEVLRSVESLLKL